MVLQKRLPEKRTICKTYKTKNKIFLRAIFLSFTAHFPGEKADYKDVKINFQGNNNTSHRFPKESIYFFFHRNSQSHLFSVIFSPNKNRVYTD